MSYRRAGNSFVCAALLGLAGLGCGPLQQQEQVAATASAAPADRETDSRTNGPAAETSTPFPFATYPPLGDPRLAPPDTTNPTGCRYAVDERPAPDLPPYSCRHEGSEPPIGSVPTPAPQEERTPSAAPRDWQVINNRLFRFSIAIPPEWYSDMRPEGGTFTIYDPLAAAEQASAKDLLPGGVVLIFSARLQAPVGNPSVAPVTERHLLNPTDSFAGEPGAIWEDPPGLGIARILHAAYARDGVVREVLVYVNDGARSEALVKADVDAVLAILDTLTPY